MMTRTCGQCGEDEVRREHRAPWMRALAYIVPIRPQICANCDAESWTLLQPGDGVLPWLSSVTVWGGVALFAWTSLQLASPPSGSETKPTSRPASTTVEPTELPTAIPSAIPTVLPTAAPTLVPTVEPTPVATAAPTPEPTALPKPSATPKAKAKAASANTKIRLRSLDVSSQGEGAQIVLDSDAGDLQHTVTRSHKPNDYVIDLPGQWTLPRGTKYTRNFDSGRLAQMRLGVHETYFRVVVSLRDGKGGAPVVVSDGGSLRIEIR